MCLCLYSDVYSLVVLVITVFAYTNLAVLPFRAGVVRTAEGQEDRLISMLTFFSLYLQMPLTGTEKTLYANWSVSHYRFYCQ